jgi:prevent-host-death family protein
MMRNNACSVDITSPEVYTSKCTLRSILKEQIMKVTIKELRTQPGRILSLVDSGVDITITKRGKPAAMIIPIREPKTSDDEFLVGFGIWKDRDDIKDSTEFVNEMRKGRKI